MFICGDFNLPNVNWSTCTANSSDSLHNYFAKLVKDNFLWQMNGFPTRKDNILDLIFTNFSEKKVKVHGFNVLIFTDHKWISFDIDMRIPKKIVTKRVVCKLKNVDWKGLTEALRIMSLGISALNLMMLIRLLQTGVMYLYRQ